MTLSSGTLNLKFMQRAAARQQAQSPSTPAGPSTPSSGRTPSQVTPASRDEKPSNSSVSRFDVLANAEAGPSTPAPVGHDQVDLTPAEKEARWSMPRPKPRRQDGEAARHAWEFEPGYMSFLIPTEEQGESSGGGGRMAFGGFGKREEEEATGHDEDGDDAQDQSVNVLDPQETKKPRKRPRATDTSPPPDPTPAPRTFVKPEGFDDRPPHPHSSVEKKPVKQLDQSPGTAPSAAHHSPSRKKKRKAGSGPEHQVSQADRLRATISSARNANGSGSTTPLSQDNVADERGAGDSAATTQQPIDLTGSASPTAAEPITQEEPHQSSSQKRKKKRKNKDRQSLGTATPISLASGTSSPNKVATSTPKGTPPASLTASTLDEKQAQMKAEKRRRRKERKKMKNEGLKVEGDEMG